MAPVHENEHLTETNSRRGESIFTT